MENTQDYQDYQDYRAEILGIVRSNASPGIMRNKLEDYHENDLADVFPDLSVAERRKLCRILNLDMLADIFEYIDEKQAAEKAKNDEKKNEKSDSKKGTQNKPFWQASKVYDTLTAVAAAAQQDYKVNGAKRGWMSKNGKLYGYYDGCYITPDMRVKEG